MIDSINFITYSIGLNFKKLKDLGIIYHKLQYRYNEYGKTYVKYGDIQDEIDNHLISKGIGFEYQKVHFMYLEKFNCIILIANAHKVLQKMDILLSDRDTYIDKINEIVKAVLGIDFSQLHLYRIDYCVDLELDYNIMYEYLHLLDKHKSTYHNIKRINEYETSIYLTSKGGQRRINIYDKYLCEKNKYYKRYQKEYQKNHISLAEYQEKHIPYYEYYENIFRIEVQNTKMLIEQQSKNIKTFASIAKYLFKDEINVIIDCKSKKSLYGYWNQSSMDLHYFKFLKDFLYNGTYYKSKYANQKIKKSNYSNCEKAHLKEFITLSNRYGITNIIKSNISKPINHKTWDKETICQYITTFISLNISFTRIEKDYMKSVDKECRKQLQNEFNKYIQVIENSSCNQNEKKDLKDLLTVLNEYGFKSAIKKETRNINNHTKWCGATVNTYIENLKRLGIDIFGLDKAQNKQKLKQAKDIISKSRHTKSWKTKLKEFVTIVNIYGIDDSIAQNNKEIVKKNKNSKHQKYSNVTVEKYIKMLEKIGINPVTIDNNSKFDSLESLYTLIQKTAKAKYFDITDKELAPPETRAKEFQKPIIPRNRTSFEF